MERREDYLKVIYKLASEGGSVTAGRLAGRLGVSSPSVSAMAKKLEADRLLARTPTGWLLTAEGERAALRVVRRHRLVETFLADVVGMEWDEVHDEAEALEHAVSARLEERMDAILGHPVRDPHGDPIPPVQGRHDETVGAPMSSAPEGCVFEVERVSDRDSAALRYLAGLGIRPGVLMEIQHQEPFDGPRWVRVAGEGHALGQVLCDLIRGSVVSTSRPERVKEPV